MIEYRPDKRLYVLGGGLTVAQAIRPAAEAGGWWVPTTGSATVVAAYQAKGAASYAASLVNLANPGTYDLTTSDAPTWDTSTGWTFTASGDQLATGWVPTEGCTVIVRLVTSATGSNNKFAFMSSGVFSIIPFRVDEISASWRVANFFATASVASSGAHVLAIAGLDGYYDGTDVVDINGSGTWATEELIIGNRADGGRQLDGSIQALAIYSTTLDATQIANLTTAMNAL